MRGHLTVRPGAVAVVAALGLVFSASPAWAEGPAGIAPAPGVIGTYLALGDSVPFGFRPGLTPETYGDPRDFVGFPEFVAADLHVRLLNASCPGETTDSFINATWMSNGCENHLGKPDGYRVSYPLHVAYASPQQSQLDYAVRTLKHATDVHLVTVQIGANDSFVCQTAPDRCGGSAAIENVAEHVRANLDTILHTLRVDGGYSGLIVVVTYYAPDYNGPMAPGWLTLDDAIARAAQANHATVADGFQAFRPTALAMGGGNCETAGLVLPNDFHPTAQGQRMLANSVESVLKQ